MHAESHQAGLAGTPSQFPILYTPWVNKMSVARMTALALAPLFAAAAEREEREDLPPMIKQKERGGNPAEEGVA